MIQESQGWWLHAGHEALDLGVIGEVYTHDCYRVNDMDLPPDALVLDIGAHIGSFARKVRAVCPNATIVCVEACPENWEALENNVPDAHLILGACTYEPGELMLHNTIKPNALATGGSVVVPVNGTPPLQTTDYWEDRRPLAKFTIEELAPGDGRIHLLKLDCEGSEVSILDGMHEQTRDRIRVICGEYHGWERFELARRRWFGDWYQNYDHRSPAEGLGLFWLTNPAFVTVDTVLLPRLTSG